MKRLFPILILLACALKAGACDVCGCSAGSQNLGILPQFHKHFVGLRWYDRAYLSDHHGDGVSTDQFRTLELWGRFYPTRRLQILAFVPFNQFSQNMDGTLQTNRGLGDASLLASYALWNTGDKKVSGFRHAFQVGAGVKLPTGTRRNTDVSASNPNLQPGTGSWDLMVNAVYTLRYNNWGLNNEAGYRVNGSNSEGFRFGRRFNFGSRAFYWWQKGRFNFLPNAGAGWEYANRDYDLNHFVSESGGYCLLAVAGMETYWKNCSLGASVQHPLYQHMGGGHIEARTRLTCTFSYLF